jgi:histone deacetylase complex regulatory component SIN3
LDLIKAETSYSDDPAIYHLFLGILEAYKDGHLDRQGVIDEVEELFADNYILLEGLNAFLPAGYSCGRDTTPLGTPCLLCLEGMYLAIAN